MPDTIPPVLLLAGTAEARDLAAALAAWPGIRAQASLAGATRQPAPLGLPTRIGGFGSAEGFAAYLRESGTGAVIDATHPFARRMSARSAAVCRQMEVPYVKVLRPAWEPGPGDRWIRIPDAAAAARHVRPPATVFLATGRQGLERFANLAGCRVICRQMDTPEAPFPFPGGRYLVGRPPFTVAGETALFRRLKVDWLVVKNSGGAGSRAKLDAARALEIPVLMIDRPAPPPAPAVQDAEAALAWLEQLA